VRETATVDVRLRPRFTARFNRRTGMAARFTATVGCSWTLAGSYYTQCQESGRIRMRLTFTPARG